MTKRRRKRAPATLDLSGVTKRRLLNAVRGAVRNVLHAHPEYAPHLVRREDFAASVAKRAAGLLAYRPPPKDRAPHGDPVAPGPNA